MSFKYLKGPEQTRAEVESPFNKVHVHQRHPPSKNVPFVGNTTLHNHTVLHHAMQTVSANTQSVLQDNS